MPRKISDKQLKNLVNDFKSGIIINNLIKTYGFTKSTIIKYLKKNIQEDQYEVLVKNQLSHKGNLSKSNTIPGKEIDDNTDFSVLDSKQKKNSFKTDFFEIAPLNYNFQEESQKDISSVTLDSIKFPSAVYMIVNKNIELQFKLLREYTTWHFLPEEDLNRKTIEIYFDIKIAKRICSKDQKVIKVPNTNVFKTVAPLLLSRGISRIVSEEHLISL